MSDESVIAYSNVLPWRDVRIRIYEFTIINSYIRIHTMAYDKDNQSSILLERNMVQHQVVSGLGTLTFVISSLPTGLTWRRLRSNGAPPRKWWLISWLNPCREVISGSYEIWLCKKTKIPSKSTVTVTKRDGHIKVRALERRQTAVRPASPTSVALLAQ